MRKTATLFLLCLTFAATAAYADHYSDTYVLPIAGHTPGQNNVMWMSDLFIRNISAEPLTVQLLFVETGDNTFDNIFPLISNDIPDGSVTVAANSTVQINDFLNGYRGLTGVTGAVILGGNRPFAVTSRAYSSRLPLGQTVPPTGDFLENSLEQADNTGFAYIPGVINSAVARTNVGFVAGAGGSSTVPMVVDVQVRNSTGAVVGSRNFVIQPGNFAHHQFNIRSIAPANFEVGSIDVRVSSGEGAVVPYASVIDNTTGEAAYIMGILPETTPNALSFRPANVFRSIIRQRTNTR